MTEPSTEEKVQLLVRSVLEAVDARLDAVRHEIATFSNEVQQRHHQLLESMAALDGRVTELSAAQARLADSAAVARLTTEVDSLRHCVESFASRPTVDASTAAADVAPAAPADPPHTHEATAEQHAPTQPDTAAVTDTHQITREELDEISRPLVTHITTQVPVVPDPSGHHEPVEHMPLRVPPMVAPYFGSPASSGEDAARSEESGASAPLPKGEIDLDQLASLLNARLGSLSLPTRQD